MKTAWQHLDEDDLDPAALEPLDPLPFCFQAPVDETWHVTAAKAGETMPGRVRCAKGVTYRPACREVEVRVRAVAVQRQPTCSNCHQAVLDAKNLVHVGEVLLS